MAGSSSDPGPLIMPLSSPSTEEHLQTQGPSATAEHLKFKQLCTLTFTHTRRTVGKAAITAGRGQSLVSLPSATSVLPWQRCQPSFAGLVVAATTLAAARQEAGAKVVVQTISQATGTLWTSLISLMIKMQMTTTSSERPAISILDTGRIYCQPL